MITRYQVQQFQNELSKSGLSPASQDHHIKLIRHALNLAVEWEFIERNVLKGVKLLNVENQLHDVATDEQLQRLVEILRTDHNRPVCNILMYLLSTGARLSEALTATWGQVDLEKGLWTIPASTAKSKKSRTVPLNSLGDPWWSLTATPFSPAILQNTVGWLDASGRANAAIVIPPLPASLAGLRFHHAFVVWDATRQQTTFVSNAVPLDLTL